MRRLQTVVFCALLLAACSLGAAARIAIPAGFPNASTTGHSGSLTSSGSITVTVAGTTLANLDISGGVKIKANNVTIRNCRIRGGMYGVQASWGYTGAVVEDCTIDGLGTLGKGVYGGNITVRRCNIYNWGDGCFILSNTLIEDCWIHDLYWEAGSHNDGIQFRGGSNVTFRHNTIQALYQQQTAAILNQTTTVGINNLLIENNFLSGGGYTLYITNKNQGGGDPTNVTVRDNVFEKDSWGNGYLNVDGSHTFQCNVFHTGEAVPANPPCAGGNQAPVADAGSDQGIFDANENGSESVDLDGSNSYDSDGTIESYVWEESSSQIATGQTPNVTLNVGSHTITLTVTDDDGATDADSVVIDVLDPGAITSQTTWQSFLIAAQTGTFTFEFDATPNAANMDSCMGPSNGVASGYNDLACTFRFNSSGNMDVRDGSSFAADVTAPYSSGTKYYVRMEIDISTHTFDVFVTPSGGSQITLASNYAFRETQSSATTLDYWALKHESGSVSVEDVTVTTGGGGQNSAPTADAGSDQTVTDTDDSGDEQVTLDGSGSSDSDGTIASYAWDESSTQIATGSGPNVLLSVGGHTITLTVTDDDDATDTDTVSITVNAAAQNQAPTANAGPDQTVTDSDENGSESVTLDGSASSDPDGTISSYVWEENSSQIATGVSPSVTRNVASHTITLTVTDDDSDTDSDTVVITVNAPAANQDPVADAGADQTVTDTDDGGDESVTLDGTGSYDSDGTISSYVWEENSSQIATGSGPSVTLDVGGHTITLTVTDDDSDTDSDTVAITVEAPTGGGTADIEFDAVSSANTGSNGTTLSWSHTIGSGDDRILVVGIGGEDGSSSDLTISSVTYDGTALTAVSNSSATSGFGTQTKTQLFYMLEADLPSSGSYTVVVTYSGSVMRRSAGAISLENAAQEAPEAVATHTGSGATSISTNITTATDGAWVVDVVGQGQSGSWSTTTGGMVERWDHSPGGSTHAGSTRPVSSAGSTTMSWSFSGSAHLVAHSLAAFAPAATAQNAPPVADAGPDQVVHDTNANGSESVTFDGAGSSDSDGTISSYVWKEDSTQIATGSQPSVTRDTGVHTIELTVTDDDSDTDTDTVTITVNVLPTANAGSDQTVTDVDESGSEQVALDGSSSSDSDGAIAGYSWEENSSQIATGATPLVTLSVGSHTIDLTVTDDDGGTDSDSVSVTINDPPTADAGPDQTVTDADEDGSETVTLDGSGSYDSDGTISSYTWKESSSQIASGVSPMVSLTTGTHTIELTVVDDISASDTDTVSITVNDPPTANAGSDQTVTDTNRSGDQAVTLDGSGSSDSDGTIASYTWKENDIQIATGSGPQVTLAVGSHTIELTVVDDDGASDTDTVDITVNDPPVADAGMDQTVVDTDDNGSESVTLDGTGSSDSDGTISSYVWKEDTTQIATGSGPSVTLDVGSHTLTLTVTDNDSATDTDSVLVDVTAPNTAPSVNAGTDDTISMPTTQVSLDATVSDDGEPTSPGTVTTTWSKLTGPGTVTFGNAANVDTTASFSTTGVYVLELLGDDGELSTTDTVQITFNHAAPSVNAGSDDTITLGDGATLDGTVSDDGMPDPPGAATTTWSLVSGPGVASFNNAAAVDTTVTFNEIGTYVLRLTGDDGDKTTTDDVSITVNEPTGSADIEFDAASADSSNTASTTLSWSHTIGSGDDRILIVGVTAEDPSSSDLTISSVTYDNETMSLVSGSSATAGSSTLNRVEMYYLLDTNLPSSGSYTVAVTYSGTVDSRTGGAISLENVAQEAAEAVETSSISSTKTISTDITPDTDGAWLVDAVAHGNPNTLAADTGQTERYEENSGYSSGGGSTLEVATAAQTTVGWDFGGSVSSRMVHAVAAFAPAAGGGGGTNEAPTADAGSDQTATDTDGNGSASVTLDGSNSSDSDGSIVSYVWTESSSQIATGSGPAVTLDIGEYTITLEVTDDDNDTDTDTMDVTVVSCTLTSDVPWQNASLPTQTGSCTVEFDMKPNGNDMDGVTGVSLGAAAAYSDTSCAVRFFTNGEIEARDADVYVNDTTVSYTSGTWYHVRMVIDLVNDEYSIYVTPAGSSEVTLGTDYSFRTQQIGVGSLDNWALIGQIGTHEVKNLTITD